MSLCSESLNLTHQIKATCEQRPIFPRVVFIDRLDCTCEKATFCLCMDRWFPLDMSQCMTKPTKWPEGPAKTQISLGIHIHPVWSKSSLCTQWVAKDPSFIHADSKDWSDWADAQADLSLHWLHMSFCWFCHALAHISFRPTYFICLAQNEWNKPDGP